MAFSIRRLAGASRGVILLALSLAAAAVVRAELSLAPLFCDGAVLQRDKPVAVWGDGKPGETVKIGFAGQTCFAVADPAGHWTAMLNALPANTTGADLTVSAPDGTRVVHDVVVGEVWLCSGQSNMEFQVRRAQNAEQEIAAANNPLIRHIQIERQTSAQPADHVATSGWKPAIPANVGEFTAAGYFFARDLQPRLGVPIGLIHSSWGGTSIEAWLSPIALASDPAFAGVPDHWKHIVAAYPAAKAAFDQRLAEWTATDAALKAKGGKAYATWSRENPKPWRPDGGPGDPSEPSVLYNGMINPLVPYALRGVLWYQGESNAGRAWQYHALFAAMINDWRSHFAQGDVPFFWVNLPNFKAKDTDDMSWARLREAQTQTLALPNTGQAIAIDLGDPYNIHPLNKQEVGRRLALLAKNRVYGLVADDSGPVFADAVREGAALRVRFRHAGGGLIAHGRPPQSLELAGADQQFHPAQGRIEHDTLVVTSPLVKDPVAVRYAWHDNPDANLYGGNGLPVTPFRSDVWPEPGAPAEKQ